MKLKLNDLRLFRWSILAVVVFVGLLVLMLLFTGNENTNRENGLYQFIFFSAGVGFSFFSGRQSARVAAADVLRPHAKAAMRRLTNLGAGIRGFGEALNAERRYIETEAENNGGMVPATHVTQAHEMLSIQIQAQIRTTTDAMEDWREFVPDEVAAVERQGNQNE